eukprot:Skav228762  [mRNA]  locus=scaffold589:317012:326206:+ [translate_table: standard]
MADDENIPILTVEQKVLLQKLKIWDKIASGNLHSIALSDVQALFDILDPGEKGHITRGECFSLLQIQNVKISRRHNNMLTFERLQWDFQQSGYLQLLFNHESWMAEPYSNWAGNWFNVIPDILFTVILLRMAHSEAKELLPAIAGGMDGIKDYFKFWNVVDWILAIVAVSFRAGWDSMLGSLFMLWSTELAMSEVSTFSVPVQVVCYLWSLTYQILVQQVMLNMLYCIVFDSYAFVKTRAGSPLTLYAQIRDAVATARETRGFVNLYTLIVQLED